MGIPAQAAIALLLLTSVSHAARIQLTQLKKTSVPNGQQQRRSGHADISRPTVNAATSGSGNSDPLDLSTVHDLLYLANITLGGTAYPVQLDTGSSDLWVQPASSPLPNSKPSSIGVNLTYGIGWANGTVSYTTAEFAGITVPNQAFLDVASAQNPALSYGADGILGLGFTSLSTIDAYVNHSGAATGRSFLYNLFADNPSEPNYIAFSLQRSSDPSDSVQGTFAIGETEPQYSTVLNNSAISTWPVAAPTRWSVLLDALLVGSKTVSLSSAVSNAPSGKAVVVLDSGTSYTYAPTDVCNAIYGGINGASYDPTIGQWTVPCDAEVDIALQFGNQVFPIHPLDVTPASLTNPNSCAGSFIPQTVSVGGGEFDWLIGDNVLRSVYSIYDYGDFDSSGHMGNPYIKLLSLVDPDQASAEFHQIRGGTPSNNITYNSSNVTSTTSGGASVPSSDTVAISDELVNTLNKVQNYFPAILAIMALNAAVLLAAVVAAIMYFCKRRSRGVKMRRNVGRQSPLPSNVSSSFGIPTGSSVHAYQPVSMALTDDTFVPPSPAFSKPGYEDKLRPGGGSEIQRPNSVA